MKNSLYAVSPVDGRYASKTESLSPYFSEAALMRYRVRVEIEYLITLSKEDFKVGPFVAAKEMMTPEVEKGLRAIYETFGPAEAEEIKDIERTTNHDVKAVEYFIKRRMPQLGLEGIQEMVHFGLTSQDVNNTSMPLMLKEAHQQVMMPAMEEVMKRLRARAEEWRTLPMLAHTHGQPASPTTLGKEFQVFVYRLEKQLQQLSQIPFEAKFGGATGSYNAHKVAFPHIDWPAFGNRFVDEVLGLKRQQFTTQIENYDTLASYLDAMKRINVILLDLCRDCWTYIGMDYFKQAIKAGEVGSSAMPHKVNPIDFENAEGNLGLANALLEHLSHKLPISRMQRDLTDSTVTRNLGMPLAHMLIAFASLSKGLDKLLLNEAAFNRDLENNWAVVAEALQTILRSVGYPNPYETLKALTRTNSKVDATTMAQFVDSLEVDDEVKARMRNITPQNYIGYADREW